MENESYAHLVTDKIVELQVAAFGIASPGTFTTERLGERIHRFGERLVEYALTETIRANVRNWRYFEAVLENASAAGFSREKKSDDDQVRDLRDFHKQVYGDDA